MKVALALLTLTFALVALGQYSSLVIQVPEVVLERDEELRIGYRGLASVVVALPNVKSFLVSHLQQLEDGAVRGLIAFRPVNLSEPSVGQSGFTVVLSSTDRFKVKVYVLGKVEKDLLSELDCPANVTIQLNLNLVLEKEDVSERLSGPSYVLALSLATFWQLLIYMLVFPFFLTASFMDFKDLKARRREKVGRHEALALIVRYLFYGSLIGSLLALLAMLASSILNLTTGHGFKVGVIDLLLPASVLTSISIAYGVLKWMGWYDVVDEGE